MHIVTVIYKTLPKYRIPFFEALRPYLSEQGVELHLIYGHPLKEEQKKQDTGHISWGQQVPNRVLKVGSRYLYWQPCLHLIKDTELVIVEQASKLLINYFFLLKQWIGGPKIAMWGHGRNFQKNSAIFLGESIKKLISHHVYWWFAYNERSAAVVRDLGFPVERITCVQNTIDVASLSKKKLAFNEDEISALRANLGLKGNNVAIFIGGLYREKRVDFLLRAALEVRKRISDFELILVGAGPEETIVKKLAQEVKWIHYIGPMFDEDKAPFFLISKVLLLPGAVGLAVIDSFVFEVPIITIGGSDHGPEIDYLIHGINGLKLNCGATPETYAKVVASMLKNNDLRVRLQNGCRIAAKKYTLEAMVEHFAIGVLKALDLKT